MMPTFIVDNPFPATLQSKQNGVASKKHVDFSALPALRGFRLALVRLNIPAVLIHFNNGSFGWIKALQALHSKSKFLSVDFTAGNMAPVAEGFGLKAFHIKSPGELEEGLDRAFAAQTPVFLDVVTESELSELPPVYSWLKKADKRGKT
ncbi:MAG: thiamine pyrophosphate-dependent enzyme [Thermodesulfobacteriota bacterium]